jgi:hypothetical protein
MSTMEAALRTTKIVHFAMLLSAVLYIFVAEQIRMSSEEIGSGFFWIMFPVPLLLAIVALVIKHKIIEPAETVLRLQPNEVAALGRWRLGYIVGFALGEAIVLFGLVLRVLGASAARAGVLYAIGIVTMLVLTPRRPR